VQRIVVVSNRVPVPSGQSEAGGLAVALRAALRETGGVWFGWSGRLSENADPAIERAQLDAIALATTDLTPSQHRGYYEGFANRTLWPLFHGRADLATFDGSAFAAYHEVNASFARRLAPLLEPGDLIWVHDYHLILLGKELRKRAIAGPIGFFLHIPFPGPEILTALPRHGSLVRSLLAYDLVGFQSERDRRHFVTYLVEEAGGHDLGGGIVEAHGRRIRAAAFPIGIDRQIPHHSAPHPNRPGYLSCWLDSAWRHCHSDHRWRLRGPP
jgi:trehalose 6-phosphate synthase